MKNYFVIIAVLFCASNLIAQSNDLSDKVIDSYASGQFDKCVKLSQKYYKKEQDSTFAFLYLSKSYYKMSFDRQYLDKHPNSWIKSLEYSERFCLSDRLKEYYSQSSNHLNNIQLILKEEIENYTESLVGSLEDEKNELNRKIDFLTNFVDVINNYLEK